MRQTSRAQVRVLPKRGIGTQHFGNDEQRSDGMTAHPWLDTDWCGFLLTGPFFSAPLQRLNVACVSDKADGSRLAVREDSGRKWSAHYGSRVKIEPMAAKVGPSILRRRVPVDNETPGIDGICESEKWLPYPCQHIRKLVVQWELKINAGMDEEAPSIVETGQEAS
jgi:hypothetical protein